MNLSDTTPLVTGAGRGLGRHLVDVLLERGAPRVYAAARDPRAVRVDGRVVPVRLDLDDPPSVDALADLPDVDLLVNNAGTAAFAGALDADPAAVARELAVNYLGTYAVIRALVPAMVRRGSGAVVNVLSLLSLAPAPPMAGYSASKAAAHSLTLALRPELARHGVTVHGVYPGGIDTDMLAGVDGPPKADPRLVAEAILAGVASGAPEIYPDPMSTTMSKVWLSDPRTFEAQFAAMGS